MRSDRLAACAMCVLVMVAVACVSVDRHGTDLPPGTRCYYMGFQDFAWDQTEEAKEATYAFLRDNTDIVCLQFGEACPWQEAYEDRAFPEELQEQMRLRKEGVGPGKNIYLEISPLNMGRSAMGGEISEAFEGKPFNDPMVMTAYLTYARRMLEYFDPAFLSIGIEVNELAGNSQELWPGFVELHKYTYTELKKEHPDLPIFATMTLHNILAVRDRGDKKRLQQLKEFLPYNDVAGISYYAFLGNHRDPENSTKNFDWIREFTGDMPMAITETAYPAEPIVLSDRTIPGSLEIQVEYFKTLFDVAQRDDYLFVINFLPRDYDMWWEKDKDKWPEWVKSWKDTGVLDGDGNPRPSYDFWKSCLAKKHVRPEPEKAAVADEKTRSFYMGFSDWSYGPDAEHKKDTYARIFANADIICMQFDDGVPWPEAYEKKPYKAPLEQRIADRLAALKPGIKTYLEISMLNMMRDGITGYWGEEASMLLPSPWDTYALDDEHMIAAYANYCSDLIERFKPAYVNYSLEGSSLLFAEAELAKAYVTFLKEVYNRVKAEHPDVPLGISATIHNYENASSEHYRAKIAEILPAVDWLGASFYPFAFYHREDKGNPENLPENSLALIAELAGGKPVAITETNWIAEDLNVPAFNLEVKSDPQRQKFYAQYLLKTAKDVNALFVIWWSIADFDLLWETFPEDVKDVGKIWRDSGLIDENLEPRPAFSVWQETLARKYVAATLDAKAPSGNTRCFHMGFSSWAYGPKEEHVEKNYKMIQQHGDLICFQFNDGVPWPEAYAGKPYSAKLEAEIASKLAHVKEGQKIYLEIAVLNMGRDDLAGYYGTSGGMPRPAPWDTYNINDEHMITAYSNFCIDVIRRFKPDYVNYSLECSDYILNKLEDFKNYVEFHKGVYENIKAVFPDVPLGVSVSLKHPDGEETAILMKNIGDLHPYMDFFAASCYAFVFFGHPNSGDPANLPEKWFSQIIEMAGGKPIAMGETNWIAEDLVLPPWNIDVKASEAWQNDYVELMLSKANETNMIFVVWWSIADFDLLWETFPEDVKDIGKIWRDTGLYDTNQKPRPGLATWDSWRARKVRQR